MTTTSPTITSPTAAARKAIEADIAELDAIERAIEHLGAYADEFRYGRFFYQEPLEMKSATDSERRAAALEWLALHSRIIVCAARHLGIDVRKFATEADYGIEACGYTNGLYVRVRAAVPASITCELVDTGRTETVPAIPAVPEITRPVFERRCPESIFAGIETEVQP